MGTLFGALLGRSGHEVWLVDRDPDRARLLSTRGLRVEGIGGRRSAKVRATADASAVPAPDLILICVKAHDTAAAAQSAARILGRAPVLTLQNGLGNVEAVARRLGRGRILGGSTALGATFLGPGRVRQAGFGQTVLAEPSGRITPRLRLIADAFRAAGMKVSLADDLPGVLWTKAIINCAINPVGALTRLRNGDLARLVYTRQCMAAAAEEGAAVAAAKRIRLAHRDMARQVRLVCRATAGNINSMLQDLLLGRRTEVDAINGAVVRAGRALGVPTPVNAALWRLVKAAEAGATMGLSFRAL